MFGLRFILAAVIVFLILELRRRRNERRWVRIQVEEDTCDTHHVFACEPCYGGFTLASSTVDFCDDHERYNCDCRNDFRGWDFVQSSELIVDDDGHVHFV